MTDDEIVVIDHTDVGFAPDRFFPQLGGDLTVATASCLLREFQDCPECGHDIDPDVKDGVQIDRDVEWTEQTSDAPGIRPVNNSKPHICENCGATLRLFVEEKARPAQWSKIADEDWAKYHLWIEMENGNYFVTNPSHISAVVVEPGDENAKE